MNEWMDRFLQVEGGAQEMWLRNDEQARLMYAFEQTHKFLVSREIEYFLAFGTLIGALRHGRRMPWDDDIDIIISSDDVPKLTANLVKYEGYEKWLVPGTEEYVPGQQNNNKHTEDGKWPGDLTLWKKHWGVPIKTYVKNKMYPFIDIHTYDKKDGRITIPRRQLAHGPTNSFSEAVDDIFPLRRADFEGLTVPVPNRSADILKRTYGDDIFIVCKVAYNHKEMKKKFETGYTKNTRMEERVKFEIPIKEFKSFNISGHRWENVHKGIYCNELYQSE